MSSTHVESGGRGMRSNAIGETTGTRRTRRISGASSQAAMVYIENWDDFQARSSALFRSDPVATRYVMKYRHCDGKLVLKVTDDKVVDILRDQRFLMYEVANLRIFIN
nr:signal recognition particle 9 kDa protein-like isoform X2 [Physcomitrium patens]|eukprot:XP_024393966.1 signal recognition particle 9 kDa protein-like isoform X2 [Physcomitrella patens]